MERDLRSLAAREHDLVVIGGGIYGVSIARDAALRGLSVALVEQGDFGAATSANSHKIVHGGLRYLQSADLRRVRESVAERTALLRTAPHLVAPQPFLMPTYGHGLRGREALLVALKLNDLLSRERDRIADPARRIPPGRMVSRAECLRLAPGIEDAGLTGGAVWYDGLMLNSERLLLSLLASAVEAGAEAANYVAATGVLEAEHSVSGIRVEDRLGGETFEIRGRVLVNACGPWSQRGSLLAGGPAPSPSIRLSKAINLVTRPVVGSHAVGLARRYKDSRGAVRKDRRLFFFVPWRDCTLIGTTYLPSNDAPSRFAVSEAEIQAFLEEINWAYPAARLELSDVRLVHAGMVPVTGSREQASDVELATRHQIRDHGREGLGGMITVTGVKYTTARAVAETAVDRVFEKLGKTPPRAISGETPVAGGYIERIDDYVAAETARPLPGFSAETIRHLIGNYGSKYREVAAAAGEDPRLAAPLAAGTEVIGAEVIHAVRREMARRLADVIFRRTELGSAGRPPEAGLRAAAEVTGKELGWTAARIDSELDEVRRAFP